MDGLRGLRSLCALGAVLAGLAMWASAARAADGTFCVNDPSCVSAGGTAEPDVQSALNAADLNEPGSELVELGPGTYTAPNGFSDSSGANAISVVGAGETETALTATTPGATVLDFNGDLNSSVSDLSVDMASSGGIGAYIPQHITNVVINYSGATAATALWTQTTTVNNVTIRMPLTGSLTTQGIYRQTGTLTADGLTITADSGIFGGGFDDSYNDTRIFADTSGIDLANDVNSPSGFAKISNSQVVMRGDSTGIVLDQISTDDGSLDLAYDTIVGDGTAGSVGVESSTQGFASEGELDMYDSIVRGFAHSLDCTQTSGSSTNLDATYSDFDATTEEFASGCSSTIANNLANLDPGFVVLADGDRTIPYNSPVIGQGDPANPSGIVTDLLGNPRPGGRSNGIGNYDLGAFQYQFTAPTAQAAASPGAVTTGTPVSFSATGSSDVNPGDGLTYSWSFDDSTSASGASVSHAFSTVGTHSATVTVTAPDGLQGTAQVSVSVTAPPLPPTPPSSPVLGSAGFNPQMFRSHAARKGHGPKHPLGSKLGFRLNVAASVTVTIERVLPGRLHGGTCVAPHAHHRGGAKCARLVTVGTLPAINAPAELDVVRFTGAVNGAPLPPGGYRAQLVATAGGLTSQTETASFTIVAR